MERLPRFITLTSMFFGLGTACSRGGPDKGSSAPPSSGGPSAAAASDAAPSAQLLSEPSGGEAKAARGVAGPTTSYGGCRIFPPDNAWNRDVSGDPIDPALTAKVLPQMSLSRGLHPDWGSFKDGYGIPITVGPIAPPVPIRWSTSYGAKESDRLDCPAGRDGSCYPIPLDAKIEGGEDRHILFLANDGAPDGCVLYELFAAERKGGGFTAGSAAIWRLGSNALRREGWTSADAAGLPILAGLVRKDEVDRGEITHALRFTMKKTQGAYIHPATHAAGKRDPSLPPMGLRLRLKASFDATSFSGPSLVIVKAMKTYGLILADNGSDWYVSGETSDRWDMGPLVKQLGTVRGGDFEIVKTGTIVLQD